jgi:hypothetical protein
LDLAHPKVAAVHDKQLHRCDRRDGRRVLAFAEECDLSKEVTRPQLRYLLTLAVDRGWRRIRSGPEHGARQK